MHEQKDHLVKERPVLVHRPPRPSTEERFLWTESSENSFSTMIAENRDVRPEVPVRPHRAIAHLKRFGLRDSHSTTIGLATKIEL